MESSKEPPTTISIAHLSPTLDHLTEKSIHAVVTLVWPYSSSTRSLGLLLSEPDFRLRRVHGQVKVTFRENLAERVANTQVGIGDEVRLHLRGTTFVDNESAIQTPGRSVGWDLQYDDGLFLEVLRSSKLYATVSVEPTVPRARTPQESHDVPATPTPVEKLSNGDGLKAWKSPAFVRPARSSFGGLVDSAFDPFAEEDGFVPGKGRKRPRFSLRSTEWRVVDEAESPDGADTPVDWTDTMDVDMNSEHDEENVDLLDHANRSHVDSRDAAQYQPIPSQAVGSEFAAPNAPPISETHRDEQVLPTSKTTVIAPEPFVDEASRLRAAENALHPPAEPPEPLASIYSAAPVSPVFDSIPNVVGDDFSAPVLPSAYASDVFGPSGFVSETATSDAADTLRSLSGLNQIAEQPSVHALDADHRIDSSLQATDLSPTKVDNHIVSELEEFASSAYLHLGHEGNAGAASLAQVNQTDAAEFQKSMDHSAEMDEDEINEEDDLEDELEGQFETDNEPSSVYEDDSGEEEEVDAGSVRGENLPTSPAERDEAATQYQEREVIELSNDDLDDDEESAESDRLAKRDFTDGDEHVSDEGENMDDMEEQKDLHGTSSSLAGEELSGPDKYESEEDQDGTEGHLSEKRAAVPSGIWGEYAEEGDYSSEVEADGNKNQNERHTFRTADEEDPSVEDDYSEEDEAEGGQEADYDEDEDEISGSLDSDRRRPGSSYDAYEVTVRARAEEVTDTHESSYVTSEDEALQSTHNDPAVSDAAMEDVTSDSGPRPPDVAAETSEHDSSVDEDDEADTGLVAHETYERAVDESEFEFEDQYASDEISEDDYDSDEVFEQSETEHRHAFQRPKTVHPEVIVLDSDSDDEIQVPPQPIAEEVKGPVEPELPRDAAAGDAVYTSDASQALDKSSQAMEEGGIETSEQDIEDGVGSHRDIEDYASYASVTDLNDEVHHIEMDASFTHTGPVDYDLQPGIAAPEEPQDGIDAQSVAIDPNLRLDHELQEEHSGSNHAPVAHGQSVDSDVERTVDTKETMGPYDSRLVLDGVASPPLTQDVPDAQSKAYSPILPPHGLLDTPAPTQEMTALEETLPASLDAHALTYDSLSHSQAQPTDEIPPETDPQSVRKDESRASNALGVSVQEHQFEGVVIGRPLLAQSAVAVVENLSADLVVDDFHARGLLSPEIVAEEASASELDVSSRESSPASVASATHEYEEPDRHASGLRTHLSYFAPLATLIDHFNASVDTISIVHKTSPIIRASAGKKDHILSFQITDPSMAGTTLIAQILRPLKSTMPSLQEGDAILLRDFRVKSFNHSMTLVSADSSAWAVFDGSDFKVTGPPVEYGPDELAFATGLRGWYQEDGAAMVADHQLQASIERALELDQSPGAWSSVAPSETGSEYSTSRGGRHGSAGSRRSMKTHRQSAVHELRDGTRYVHDRDEVHELRDGTMY